MTHIFRWNRLGRKGCACRIVARGKLNSCMIEFADGVQIVTSRNAIMRIT